MPRKVERHGALETMLADRSLHSVFQPIVDLELGTIVGGP
jgi:sensor c-di-GMP phosphodiesterase-like protein